MVDVLTYLQSVITERKTVRDIAAKLLNSMPSTYDTVYVIWDTYGEAGIKSVECQICGYGEKCIFKIIYETSTVFCVEKNKEDSFNLVRWILT